jgi:hypothetical protein
MRQVVDTSYRNRQASKQDTAAPSSYNTTSKPNCRTRGDNQCEVSLDGVAPCIAAAAGLNSTLNAFVHLHQKTSHLAPALPTQIRISALSVLESLPRASPTA